MPLREHVYCVAVTFKMTEQLEQQICIKFCIKLEHFSAETIQMIQKAAAMGNRWLAASSWQHIQSWITSCEEFFWQNIMSPRWLSAPYSPDLPPWDLGFFPKLKSPLKGKRFQTIDENQGTMTGQPMRIGRTVWGPKVPTLKGLRCHCPIYNVSCILYLLQ